MQSERRRRDVYVRLGVHKHRRHTSGHVHGWFHVRIMLRAQSDRKLYLTSVNAISTSHQTNVAYQGETFESTEQAQQTQQPWNADDTKTKWKWDASN